MVPELRSGDLPMAGDASITRLYLFDAIDTVLAAVSARQPLLVVLDDLHWADAGTLAIIRHLLRSDRAGPLLVVGTYRDTDVDRTHPLALSLHDLQREPGTVRVSLSGLQRDAVGALIADRAGHTASEEFVDLIYDETEGNPYFAEEVLAHLSESGAMVENVHGDWVNTVPVSDVGVPEGIRDALGRRLSRLPVDTNEVLSVAAVVGREFDVVVVADVLSLALLDVIERLEPALDAGLVHLRAGNSAGSFAHALVRESLLGELRSTRRTRLHWLVGRAWASRAGVAPAVVAHHLCEGALAGDVGEAVAAALAAAEAADQLGAWEDAFAWSERAIEVLGDAAEQYPELYNQALYSRGQARNLTNSRGAASNSDLIAATSLALDRGDYVLALRALAQAIRVRGVRPTEVEILATRAVDETPAGTPCAAVARGLHAFLAAFRGRPFDAADAEAAIEALDTAIPLDLSWWVRDCFLDLLLALPDLDRCRDVHLSTLALGERHESPLMIGLSTLGLGYLAARRADRPAMEAAAQRVRAAVRGGAWSVVHVLDISLAMADGRLDDAEVLIHDASNLVGPDSPLAYMFAYEAGVLAHLRGFHDAAAAAPHNQLDAGYRSTKSEIARQSARDGDWETTIASLTSLMPHSVDELRKPLPIIDVLASVAEAAGIVRDVDRAAMLIPALQPYSGQMAIGHSACELKLPVSSVLGRLRALTGDLDGGVADCEAGLALAESMQTPLLVADSSMVLADTLLIRGRDTDIVRARELLTDAIGVSDSCGAYGVADMGRRLLDTARLP
jgi:tetratricopeptide (TPR) repeat protein